MFSTGQIYFAFLFVMAFVIASIYVYRKDLALHKIHYKGSSKWIFLTFILFIGLLFVIKIFLKKN
jgi:hypothetical protein